jgi:heme-degrading monooxygenase HmoA
MIKVIVGYKVRRGEDITPILLELTSHAMTYPGFVGAENLISEEDFSIIAVISTWEKAEYWRIWEKSTIRQEMLRKAETFLVEAPKVTVYRTTPTLKWV